MIEKRRMDLSNCTNVSPTHNAFSLFMEKNSMSIVQQKPCAYLEQEFQGVNSGYCDGPPERRLMTVVTITLLCLNNDLVWF
ncbi:hypothetical protein CEXT_327811 [Caerostris extrusa]|uniref:Uncharacterized protein n=1 Tax=Caerostris extrusa TaxID=172846 RepID=A0AAV4M2L6_CAEEX|nr:hypothetical protein CEXT_327811 [Caerostris extrusa]